MDENEQCLRELLWFVPTEHIDHVLADRRAIRWALAEIDRLRKAVADLNAELADMQPME